LRQETPALLAGPAAARDAMAPLAWMRGQWRGEAWRSADGTRQDLIQTERVTRAGDALLLDGRAFERDGRATALHAVGRLTYDPARSAYVFQTTALSGQHLATVTATGWSWSAPGLRFTSTYARGVWREVGETIGADGAATPIFEMRLRRVPGS
jgi:hypothetical protein